ncbi:MAG: GAF domain-containing sensor histidine kinase, partial [Acidobacteriota bacterium]
LGVGLRDGQRLRLDRIQDHPRSAGFPANHPPMQTLLAVPVAGRGGYRGNLYVADKRDGQPFSIDDEDVLARFAVQAAIALDNAWLHAQVRGLTVAEERLRLARELHDGQAQVLAAVNMQAQVVTELLRQQRLDDARDVLDRLAQLARSVLTDVREGIVGLRAVGRPGDDLATMLRRHVETWRDHQADLAVTLDLPAQLPELDPSVALQLLRIVQEALANVRKHARATRVAIGAEARTGGLALTVVDDGVGFDPAQLALHRGRPRFGLAILRERAEAIGAQLDVRSQPGAGTTVAVSYDVASAATAARAT